MSAGAGQRVVAGLSGGVDSAVAALLLLEAGYEVHGLYMSNWEDQDSYCSDAQDYQDARAVARELGIVLHRVSFADDYRRLVFEEFLAEYRRGRTPNPDVLCNREIKFGACLRYAQRLGATVFATGHYARLGQESTGPTLLRARDAAKDQSYFLCGVERARFAAVQFPIGELHKAEVRERALRAGLPVHDKPDSTGICFIGERPFAQFLARYIPETPGPIETIDGRVLGRHRGLPFYTLGQRSGLEIGGISGGAGEPWYVARKEPRRNALLVVPGAERAALGSSVVTTGTINWLCEPPVTVFAAGVKLRYRQADQAASVELQPDHSAVLRLQTPQWAATPGQTAALYAGERCLGGGVIEETL
jgi:tRNA-specific 2-thiouridylase